MRYMLTLRKLGHFTFASVWGNKVLWLKRTPVNVCNALLNRLYFRLD